MIIMTMTVMAMIIYTNGVVWRHPIGVFGGTPVRVLEVHQLGCLEVPQLGCLGEYNEVFGVQRGVWRTLRGIWINIWQWLYDYMKKTTRLWLRLYDYMIMTVWLLLHDYYCIYNYSLPPLFLLLVTPVPQTSHWGSPKYLHWVLGFLGVLGGLSMVSWFVLTKICLLSIRLIFCRVTCILSENILWILIMHINACGLYFFHSMIEVSSWITWS